jgi:hypothetical protein
MQYVVVLLLEGRSSIRCSGVFKPAARISPVKGDPVKCPDAETVGVCSSEITPVAACLLTPGSGYLDDVTAGTFIDPRPHAIPMREPRFLWRSPLIGWTKTKALFGPE